MLLFMGTPQTDNDWNLLAGRGSTAITIDGTNTSQHGP